MMKKLLLFLFFLPFWGLGGFGIGFAHASVAVQVLATDFPNKKVTLHVEYDNAVNGRVWVWIYLCDMQGMFEPAEISAVTATGGSVQYSSIYTRGFFVTASPATVTVTLSNVSGQFSCCAYGSDTPPNMTESNGTYTFKGTPPFMLIAADGAATQTVTGNTLPASALTITPVILTDETGYPNIFCPYTGNDLYNVAAYFCQPRTSGAKNWEAWIKDSRDNELYRIVLMPDNNWWLAQNVKYAATGRVLNGCDKDQCGRFYTGAQASDSWGGSSGYGQGKQGVCPPGWIIPMGNEVLTMVNACGSTDAERAAALRAYNSSCIPKNDTYGFASLIGVSETGVVSTAYSSWRTGDAEDALCSFSIDHISSGGKCGALDIRSGPCGTGGSVVRCFRL